jgi:CubicO group peptidase (beta-lactamase class C family)
MLYLRNIILPTFLRGDLMRRFTLALIPLLLLAGSANADPVDDIVQAEMKRTSTPGISLAVVKDGKIIREQGYGLANVEHQAPVTPETIFQSGSVGQAVHLGPGDAAGRRGEAQT